MEKSILYAKITVSEKNVSKLSLNIIFYYYYFFFPVCLFPISGGPNTDVSQHIGEDKYISKTGHGPFSGRTGGAVY